MEAKFVEKEKDVVEVQFEGMDEGLANVVVEKLLQKKSVKQASVTLLHPLIPTPSVRVRAGDARKELVEALDETADELKKALKDAEKLE